MKALSLVLRTALGIVALFLVAAIAFAFLPASVSNGLVIFSLSNVKILILGVTSILFALYVVRLLRNVDRFSSTKRVVLAIVTLAFLGCFYVVGFRGVTTDDTDCQRYNYNDKLNGGIKQVGGKTYIVNVCGSGRSSDSFADQNERVKIVVADAQGSALATRYFFVFWGGRPGHDPIEIHNGRLFYFDASDTYDGTRSISLPPTTFDWIAARIPAWLR